LFIVSIITQQAGICALVHDGNTDLLGTCSPKNKSLHQFLQVKSNSELAHEIGLSSRLILQGIKQDLYVAANGYNVGTCTT